MGIQTFILWQQRGMNINYFSLKFFDKIFGQNFHKPSQTNKINFVLSESARSHIAEQGYSRKYGARFLKRFFEKHIETEIATLIIKSKSSLKEITCNFKTNRLIFNTC